MELFTHTETVTYTKEELKQRLIQLLYSELDNQIENLVGNFEESVINNYDIIQSETHKELVKEVLNDYYIHIDIEMENHK